MERFKKAMVYVFKHEGGYNDIEQDKGGATNWGVSLRFLKAIGEDVNKDGVINFLDIKSLTKEQAEDIYYNNFWRPYYDVLPEKLAIKMFDTAINSGHKRSNIILQKALNTLGSNVAVDGLIGKGTIMEVSKYLPMKILVQYSIEQKKFYEAIVKNDPSQMAFINGWTNRANWIPV